MKFATVALCSVLFLVVMGIGYGAGRASVEREQVVSIDTKEACISLADQAVQIAAVGVAELAQMKLLARQWDAGEFEGAQRTIRVLRKNGQDLKALVPEFQGHTGACLGVEAR